MKRKIKFRGKDGCGTWFFGDLHQWDNGEVYIGVHSSTWSDDGLNSQSYPTFNEIDPDTVGQFTGWHDKNDKEIYEGDIVKCNDENYVVKFEYGMFYASVEECDKGIYGGFPLYFILDRYEECEVIGNVYDNFNLLQL